MDQWVKIENFQQKRHILWRTAGVLIFTDRFKDPADFGMEFRMILNAVG